MWHIGISFRIRLLVVVVTIWTFSLLVVSLVVPHRPPQLSSRLLTNDVYFPSASAGSGRNSNIRAGYFTNRLMRFPVVIYASKGKPTADVPSNEFSRTLQVDRILKAKRGATAAAIRNAYSVTIEADETECRALAQRFDLSAIASLSADLQLRPSLLSQGGVSSSSVEVEGSCKATVTQRCVRTNEDFDVQLEFPLVCIVRPVIPTTSSQDALNVDSRNDREGENAQRRKQPSSGGSKNTFRLPDRNIDEMDVMELQRMLQLDMSNDDDLLMEDEAIYSLDDGLLDVGELVAQFFWFKLDPYPKKPGTGPVQISITG